MQITVGIYDQEVKKLLQSVIEHTRHPRAALAEIGEIVATSIRRNFTSGGRPKWDKSERAKAEGGQTLIDRAILKNSFTVEAGDTSVSVGTSDKRAGTLHFGAKKGSFGTVTANVAAYIRELASGKKSNVAAHTRKTVLPWGDIPARPFLLVQDEDWDEILRALKAHLERPI